MQTQKLYPLPSNLPIPYDPNIDQLLEILLLYPELYEPKLTEHFIDVLIYDNEIFDNVGFYNTGSPNLFWAKPMEGNVKT